MQSILGNKKKALILGAGFVVKPTLVYLVDHGVEVTVACRTIESATKLCGSVKNATPIALDVQDAAALEEAVGKVDVAISLIPYIYHPLVIKAGIAKKVNIVTTSYISPGMLELEPQIKEAGITVMNEIGLDPGIDHLYAVKTIHEVHQAGGKIKSFLSYCGGLPAPEASDNPLGYKFSWSARGMLLALGNTARFLQNGKTTEISGPDLMSSAKAYTTGYPGYNFVAYANRDSTPFAEKYAIPEAETIIRGTLRYAGFPELVKCLVDLGFLSQDRHDFLSKPAAWRDVTASVVQAKSSSEEDLLAAISSKTKFVDEDQKARILAGLRWIGLFSSTAQTLPRDTPLDTLCATLEAKMAYAEGERDFVFLQHRFEIEHANGEHETRTSTLCEYGSSEANGYTAMAKTVGLPCGVAVMSVLQGELSKTKGLLAPYTEEICAPLREQLKKEFGIEMVEKTVA